MPAPVKIPHPKKAPGRPCLLTPTLAAILFRAIEDAMPLKQAAMLAGISYHTLNRWRNRGASESAEPEFRHFCKQVERSEAIAMQRLVSCVNKAAETDYRAAAWMLQRRFREEFGEAQHVEHSGPGGKPIQAFTYASEVEPEVLQRMKKQTGVRELAGMLGDILLRKRREKMEAAHAARMKRARLRE